MADLFLWWFWIQLLGLVALPPAFLLFRRLPDRGYFFAKPLGLLLVTYVLWLGGSFRLLPNGRGAALLVVLIVAGLSLVLLRRCRRELAAHISRNAALILFAEALFLLLFVAWAAIRAYNPDISHTEQPMDFAFLNASLRSEFFPPRDPWLAGHGVSYYYLGYLMMATISNLSGITAAVSYNLALALLFALTGLGAFGLVYNLVASRKPEAASTGQMSFRPVLFGLLGVLLVLGIGNMEGGLEMLRAHGFGSARFWEFIGIKDLANPYQSSQWYPTDNWWWWRATRVIDTLADGKSLDYTISEFPFFSFLLGDLHPHVMALPFGLLALALAADTALTHDAKTIMGHSRLLATALILGSLFFLNSWDFPTYGAIYLASLGLTLHRTDGKGLKWRTFMPTAASTIALAVLLFLPFYIGFRTQASGILPVRNVYSQPLHLFIFWGPLLVILLGSLLAMGQGGLLDCLRRPRRGIAVLLVALAPFVLWAIIALSLEARGSTQGTAPSQVATKLLFFVPWLILVPLALAALLHRLRARSGSSTFALLLMVAGLVITMGVELFFIRDTFGTRMNTVFKFYYQAWLLLSIAGAYGLASASQRMPARVLPRAFASAWLALVTLAIAIAIIYPVAALAGEIGRSSGGARNLDGLEYVARTSPHEYEAVRWLQTQVIGTPVIVESVGGQYSQYARISARTGLPTVIGWPGHESQWRGSDALFRGRPEDVDIIYKSEDLSQVRSLLAKYNATYIYVGDLERAKYGPQVAERFSSAFAAAFANQGVTIFEVDAEQARLAEVNVRTP